MTKVSEHYLKKQRVRKWVVWASLILIVAMIMLAMRSCGFFVGRVSVPNRLLPEFNTYLGQRISVVKQVWGMQRGDSEFGYIGTVESNKYFCNIGYEPKRYLWFIETNSVAEIDLYGPANRSVASVDSLAHEIIGLLTEEFGKDYAIVDVEWRMFTKPIPLLIWDHGSYTATFQYTPDSWVKHHRPESIKSKDGIGYQFTLSYNNPFADYCSSRESNVWTRETLGLW